MERPSVDVRKVCSFIMQLAREGSHFHGDIRIKFHDGKIVNVHNDESLDLYMFKMSDQNEPNN